MKGCACHRGDGAPEPISVSPEPETAVMGPSAMYRNRGLREAPIHSSLPGNMTEALIGPDMPVEGDAIQVRFRTEREADDAFDDRTGTELTGALMTLVSDSLGGERLLLLQLSFVAGVEPVVAAAGDG
ncbi:MAG: hypothetical protein AAGI51_09120, partial [Pseudomonadota bacterium]